jgi:hypothetical protein
MRAERERVAALDAFNYLNGKNLQLWVIANFYLRVILKNETQTSSSVQDIQ